MSLKFKKKRKNNAITTFFHNHKYAFVIFGIIFLYNFFVVNVFNLCQINQTTYGFYLVDFSLGFCSKLLPGAIYNALFSTTDPETVNTYVSCLYHIFLLGLSFVLDCFIKVFNEKNRKTALIVVLFFITGPSTFFFHAKFLGLLDTYWLFFGLALILSIQNKYLKWITPLFFALSVMIHFASIITYLPLFALIILFEASQNKENRKQYFVILIISLIVSVVIFLYFLLFEESNLVLSLEEFHEFFNNRNLSDWTDGMTDYYDYSLYKISIFDNESFADRVLIDGNGFFVKAVNTVWGQICFTFETYFTSFYSLKAFLISFVSTLPLITFCYKYIISKVKNEKENKLQKIVSRGFLILFPTSFVLALMFSPDFDRWFFNSYIILSTAVLYMMFKSEEDLQKCLIEINCKRSTFVTIAYYIIYAIVVPHFVYL